MTTRRTPIRILLALGWYDHRLHRGIERYARDHGWSIARDIARNRTIPWGWEGDGILAWLGADDELAQFVVKARKPTVDFSCRRPHLKFNRVLEDTVGAARMVAEHLLSRGLRNFLFYSDRDNWIYDERGLHFVRALRQVGHDARWLRWHEASGGSLPNQSWRTKRQWLVEAIHATAKPVGVFAASDDLASDVLDACELAGISVPHEVSIIGAGDSLLAVNSMSTPISSVDTNLELLGYRGAQELDQLLRHRHVPSSRARIIRIPPAGVIARSSSDTLAVSHPGIARSVRYIWENFREPIGVGHLAGVASLPLRSFYKLFAASVGRGPGAEIQRVRVEQARRLLKQSCEKLSVIAGECGYSNSNSFTVAFKKATGLSPRHFQARCAVPT